MEMESETKGVDERREGAKRVVNQSLPLLKPLRMTIQQMQSIHSALHFEEDVC